MSAPTELELAAASVLVDHQRKDVQHCTCGWGELGRSHAVHQAQLVVVAILEYQAGQAAINAVPYSTRLEAVLDAMHRPYRHTRIAAPEAQDHWQARAILTALTEVDKP